MPVLKVSVGSVRQGIQLGTVNTFPRVMQLKIFEKKFVHRDLLKGGILDWKIFLTYPQKFFVISASLSVVMVMSFGLEETFDLRSLETRFAPQGVFFRYPLRGCP